MLQGRWTARSPVISIPAMRAGTKSLCRTAGGMMAALRSVPVDTDYDVNTAKGRHIYTFPAQPIRVQRFEGWIFYMDFVY